MTHSSVDTSAGTNRRGPSTLRTMRTDGTPIYRYTQRPGRPPVSVVLMDTDLEPVDLPPDHQHAHDFLVLVYVERGSGVVGVDGRDVPLRDGEVHAVLPGQVVGEGTTAGLCRDRAWSVAFTPDAVPALASVSPLSWSRHPLLALFGGQNGGSALVPEADRPRWLAWLTELDEELGDPGRLGHNEAATALLTRILVASARLAPTAPNPPDDLVDRVFEQIEATFTTPVSAGDIARTLGYTAGHLTTVVRERSGRTLLDWITERRMTEARRLLRETGLPLDVIATRTGLRDAAYLIRRFKDRHGITPDRWRRSL